MDSVENQGAALDELNKARLSAFGSLCAILK